MEEKFTPYNGSKPYVFISYARGDLEKVLSVSHRLYEEKYRLWYDEGIPPGAKWPAVVEKHLRESGAVLFFMSAKTSVSPNCFSEMKTACELGLPVICVPCDECAEIMRDAAGPGEDGGIQGLDDAGAARVTALTAVYAEKRKNRDRSSIPKPAEWIPVLEKVTFIDCVEEAAAQKALVLNTGKIGKEFTGPYDDGKKKRKKWLNKWVIALIFSFLFLAASGAGTWALANGYLDELFPAGEVTVTPAPAATPAPTPRPVIDIPIISNVMEFPDSLQEKAYRKITGIREGDIDRNYLRNVTELYFCGGLVTDGNADIRYGDGRWYCNNAPVNRGKISDMSLIGQTYYLEYLTLVNENISSMKGLNTLPLLRELNLAGNPLQATTVSGGFESLEILNISHTEVKNLSFLSGLPSLRTVYVSADMFPLTLDPDAVYEVVLIK